MSNKLIDKNRVKELREKIKMLDVLDVAREKGLEEGKNLGMKEGRIEAVREMLIDALFEKFNQMPSHVSEQIRTIQNHDALKFLFRQVFRCDDMEAFEAVLSRLE